MIIVRKDSGEKKMEEKSRQAPEKKKEEAKVILDGNAFYELDMECVRRKEREERKERNPQKRQRR